MMNISHAFMYHALAVLGSNKISGPSGAELLGLKRSLVNMILLLCRVSCSSSITLLASRSS